MIRFLLLPVLLLAGCSNEPPSVDFEDWKLEELSVDQGFSVTIPPYDVAAGHESQRCYFIQVPDLNRGGDVWISRVLSAKNPGSHHLNVFRVRTLVNLRPEDGAPVQLGKLAGTLVDGGDEFTFSGVAGRPHPCWDSANWADWPLTSNSQDSNAEKPYTDWVLPENVGIRLVPNEWLMIQSHYVNASEQRTTFGARIGINFYRSRGFEEPMELGTLFATQQSIRICQSQPKPVFSGTCSFPAGSHVTITAANGHFHKRGSRFSMFAWDGLSDTRPAPPAMFYESRQWNDPPMATGIELPVRDGGGIWWDCAYQWSQPEFGCDEVNGKDPLHQNDCCYTFGGNTDVGEHCNVFLYYYPKTNTDVFCN